MGKFPSALFPQTDSIFEGNYGCGRPAAGLGDTHWEGWPSALPFAHTLEGFDS